MLQLLMILLGGIVLLLSVLISKHLQQKISSPFYGPRVRVRFPRKVVKLLRQAAERGVPSETLMLMEALLLVRQQVRHLPPLPSDADGDPRILVLARTLMEEAPTADHLAKALDALPSPTTSEVDALPVCVATACAQRLAGVLQAMKEHPSQQLMLADEARRIARALQALRAMDWPRHGDSADPVHALLMADALYARMDPQSQHDLRLRVERICRLTHREAEDVLHVAAQLSREALPQTMETSLVWWLMEPKGLTALQHALRTRRGYLQIHLMAHPERVRYGMLLAWSLMAAIIFLQCRHPVAMLPFFLPVVGHAPRIWLRRRFISPQSRLAVLPPNIRTLAVLPVVMQDAHEAIQAVRRVKTLLHTFPEGTDLLLIGDFETHTSPMSASAQSIMTAASSAVLALEDPRVMYLQRSRPDFGYQGAIHSACRLAAHGECSDVLACATFPINTLHRRYTFLLSVPEDETPAPGLLDHLTATLCHPLRTHYPTPDGYRGYSCAAPIGSRIRLISPIAYLEHTDGVAPNNASLNLLDALSGCVKVPSAPAVHAAPLPPDDFPARHSIGVRCGLTLHWQLPFVQTQRGFIRNPLKFLERWRMRSHLADTLLPFCQLMLMGYALLCGSWPLMLIALFAPMADRLHRISWRGFIDFLCRTSLLPIRAAASVLGILQGASGWNPSFEWPVIEVWVQGIAATLFLALSVSLHGGMFTGMMAGLLFFGFPWAHRWQTLFIRPLLPLTDAQKQFLMNALQATWQYFHLHTQNGLIPDAALALPASFTDQSTTPKAISGSILATVCAREARFITVADAAARFHAVMDALEALPMPAGLPCELYDLNSHTVLDASVDAASTGILACSLLTAAQALRSWLAELPVQAQVLSGRITAWLRQLDIRRLYDEASGLLHAGFDADGQPLPLITAFADEALLLSIAGCALQMLPAEHLSRLSRTRIRLHGREVYLSQHGSASGHLLANLFLPQVQGTSAFFELMVYCGRDGLFGQDQCFTVVTDASRKPVKTRFGIGKIALEGVSTAPVYAPWAAALGMTVDAARSADALEAFAHMDCTGDFGFLDAVDAASGTPSSAYSTWHQGVMAAALAHAVADAPIAGYFSAIPEVEALLPLLHQPQSPLILRALPGEKSREYLPVLSSRMARSISPIDAHLLGSADFCAHIRADGECDIWTKDGPLAFAVRCYVGDGGRIYRIGGNAEVCFMPGAVRIHQVCGSLRVQLDITLDALRRQVLHLLTVTNLSTRDQTIDLVDFLLPLPQSGDGKVESSRPESAHLLCRSREPGDTVHHRIVTAAASSILTACTDAEVFLGRADSPAVLTDPPDDLMQPSLRACMSFRWRTALGGRSQTSALFITSANDAAVPDITAFDGIARLCAMQQEAMAAQCGLSAEEALAASLLTGAALHTPLHIPQAHIAQWFALHGIALRHGAAQEILWEENAPLIPQIEALYQPAVQQEKPRAASPGLLPEMALTHQGSCSGFDAETGDLILRLERGQTPPLRWENRHLAGNLMETVGDDTLPEQVRITLEDGSIITLCAADLPRIIRFGPGITTWKAYAQAATLTLHAANAPGMHAFLRVLRIKPKQPVHLHINGMHRETNDEAVWLRFPDGRILFLEDAHASDLLRQVRLEWLDRLSSASLPSEDDMLYLLANRTLPMQALTSQDAASVAAMIHFAPLKALRRLIRLAQTAEKTEDWILLALLLSLWHGEHGVSVCTLRLAGHEKDLRMECRDAFLSAVPNGQHLPGGPDAPRMAFLLALAAKALSRIKQDESLEMFRRNLLNAADAQLWQGGYYGDGPLRLDVQCLAALCYGDDARVRQALRTALTMLKDEETGLLRHRMPDDSAYLPGLPQNGGVIMEDCVLAIAAMLRHGLNDEARALVMAIDPIRMSDTPLKSESFRASPNRLPGGICLYPMEPGRAIPEGGDSAAAWLYHLLHRYQSILLQ